MDDPSRKRRISDTFSGLRGSVKRKFTGLGRGTGNVSGLEAQVEPGRVGAQPHVQQGFHMPQAIFRPDSESIQSPTPTNLVRAPGLGNNFQRYFNSSKNRISSLLPSYRNNSTDHSSNTPISPPSSHLQPRGVVDLTDTDILMRPASESRYGSAEFFETTTTLNMSSSVPRRHSAIGLGFPSTLLNRRSDSLYAGRADSSSAPTSLYRAHMESTFRDITVASNHPMDPWQMRTRLSSNASSQSSVSAPFRQETPSPSMQGSPLFCYGNSLPAPSPMSSTGSLPTHLVELRTGSPSGMQYILIEEGNTSDCSGPDSSHHGHGYDRDKSDDGSDNGGAGEHEPLHHEDVPHAVPTVTASPSIAEPQPAPQQWKIFQPPPSVQDVVEALKDLDALLTPRKPSGGRSTKTFSGTDALRERLQQMQLFFVIFTTESLTWTKASVQAAKLSRASPDRAVRLRTWSRAFLKSRHQLPVTRKTTWNSSALENEDLRRAVTDHLITLGPHIRALDIVEFLADKAVQTKFGLKKGICLSTAQGWMHKLGYRWKPIPNGQYVDGHERADVVKYRQEVYIPALEKLRLSLREYNEDGTEYVPIGPKPFETPKPPAVHFHDESTFYANDRRKTRWVHGLEGAVPRTKGEGASLMISDFYSAEFGWLRSPTNPNRAARRLFKAGKNRDGYFTHEDVINQAMEAAAIVKDAWPEYNHVFVFDNAPTHMKRPDDSLSARNMPKGPSDTSKKTKTGYRQNFGVDRTLRRTDGTVVYAEKDGKILKERVNMVGAQFTDGSPQSLYFPSDYPVTELCGKFKGMAVILQERGYTYANRLPAECPDNFKCPKPPLDYPNDDSEWYLAEANHCCCRRLLYHQPDFQSVRSLLETNLETLGIQCIFLPKFHCELNPIEQCWGYAKREYRKCPPSKLEADLQRNLLASIESVPLLSMRRFYTRSMRMARAYEKGLNGQQAAWAAKKYSGHRVIPENIFNELTKAGLHHETAPAALSIVSTSTVA